MAFKEQIQIYNSARWRKVRQEVIDRDEMRCKGCGKIVTGKSIVDHIIEITPANVGDDEITYGLDNLQLLCMECHNLKTNMDKGKQVKLSLAQDAIRKRVVNLI